MFIARTIKNSYTETIKVFERLYRIYIGLFEMNGHEVVMEVRCLQGFRERRQSRAL